MSIPAPDPLVSVKLASVAVHAKELLAPGGHEFDAAAIDGLLAEQDVKDYLRQLDDMALLPKPREAT